MKHIEFNWLIEDWKRLESLRARLPHALLIHGSPDIGKRALASHFAQSLLCQSVAAMGNPCGQCQACRWFEDGNHPDFRALLPEILQLEEGLAVGEEEGDATQKSSKAKTPSREIKIEQVRALDGFFNIGTHRGGARVVLVYPADTLNVPAGNALLKTLEEPAPETVFLLVSSHADQMLPTIRSRASKFLVSTPDTATCLAWLENQGVSNAAERLAESGGAPLAALRAGQTDTFEAERSELLDALAGSRFDPLVTAERCEKAGPERVTLWLTRWVADLLRACQCGDTSRYHPSRNQAIGACAARLDPHALHRYFRKLMAARRIAGHPLNARLFAEELLIDYGRLIHNKA